MITGVVHSDEARVRLQVIGPRGTVAMRKRNNLGVVFSESNTNRHAHFFFAEKLGILIFAKRSHSA